MQQNNKNALLWLGSGLVLSLLVLLVVCRGLSGKTAVTDPEGIPEAAHTVLKCIKTGDWNELGHHISGDPVLDPAIGVAVSAEGILHKAFQDSLQWSFREPFLVRDGYVIQRVAITCLDIPEVVDAMTEILNSASAEEDPMYWSQLMAQAAKQVLARELPLLHQEITLTLHRQQGAWVVVPDEMLLHLLSGFLAS